MIGATLGGKYTIVRRLGEGGMGDVYEARHSGTGKRVALKVISGEMGNDPRQMTRFEQEARAAGVIESDHIVQVFDAGWDEASGVPFLAMEYLVGEDMEQLLTRLGPISADLALRIGAQACMGLEKAHAAGIVHRDVKPANLFLTERDSGEWLVKVLDFGLAKTQIGELGPEQKKRPLTQAGSVVGSPLYMSPEQARGKTLDHRTDVWSLGVVLYQALTGRTPFDGSESVGDFLYAVCTTPVAPMVSVAPWVDRAVAQAVERALVIDPRDRYPSAAAMREALEVFLPQGSAIRAAMLVPAAATLSAGTPSPPAVATPPPAASSLHLPPGAILLGAAPPRFEPPPAAPRRAKSGVAGWVAGPLLLALGGGAVYALGWLRNDPRPAPKPRPETSAPAVTETATAAPPSPTLAALEGRWWSETGQIYDAVAAGETVELRVHDPEQFPGQGYVVGEASFILHAVKGEATSFRVEARVRPAPPRGTVYDHARSAGSCVVSWSQIGGKPLMAQSAIDRLVVQTVRVDPAASAFEREGFHVIGCAGLVEAHATEGEIVLGREPVQAPHVVQVPHDAGAHDAGAHDAGGVHDAGAHDAGAMHDAGTALGRGNGGPCTSDAQCSSHRCQASVCR